MYGFLASEFCLGHLGAVGRLDSYVVAGNHAKLVLQVKTRACSLGKMQRSCKLNVKRSFY